MAKLARKFLRENDATFHSFSSRKKNINFDIIFRIKHLNYFL